MKGVGKKNILRMKQQSQIEINIVKNFNRVFWGTKTIKKLTKVVEIKIF